MHILKKPQTKIVSVQAQGTLVVMLCLGSETLCVMVGLSAWSSTNIAKLRVMYQQEFHNNHHIYFLCSHDRSH